MNQWNQCETCKGGGTSDSAGLLYLVEYRFEGVSRFHWMCMDCIDEHRHIEGFYAPNPDDCEPFANIPTTPTEPPMTQTPNTCPRCLRDLTGRSPDATRCSACRNLPTPETDEDEAKDEDDALAQHLADGNWEDRDCARAYMHAFCSPERRKRIEQRAKTLAAATLLALSLAGSASAHSPIPAPLPIIGTPAYSAGCSLIEPSGEGFPQAYCPEDGATYYLDMDGQPYENDAGAPVYCPGVVWVAIN